MGTTSVSTSSPVNVDVQQIITALQQKLASLDSWVDLLTSGTGTTLIELVATATGFSIFAVERAFQEAFPDSAILPSSLYSIARLLGSRISRKLPASCSVLITKPADGNAYSIPAYSTFSYPGGFLFNRQAINFSSTQVSQTVTLYQGQVKTLFLSGLGTDYQTFISADASFGVSDADVQVSVSGSAIPVVTDGLWRYPASINSSTGVVTPNPAVQDRTTLNGALELNFGNSTYGTSPGLGAPVNILYAVTNGLSGNNANFSGTSIAYDTYSTVVASSGLTGGADQLPPSLYQRIAPPVSASQGRACTYSEYNAIAVTYPGVYDAKIQGQAQIAPSLPSYMAVLRLSLFTTSTWSAAQYATFLSWLQARSMSPMNFWRVDPVGFQFSITANVYCNATADLATVQGNVNNALAALVAPQPGIIGRTTYMSDIYGAIENADPEVLYTQVLTPTTPVVTSPSLYNLAASVTASGSIPAAGRTYQVTCVSMLNGVANESVPVSVSASNQNGSNFEATLSWVPMNGAVNFINIYTTNTQGQLGLLAQVAGTVSSYVDTGNVAPNIALTPPTVDGFPLFYPEILAINLNMYYASDRGIGQE